MCRHVHFLSLKARAHDGVSGAAHYAGACRARLSGCTRRARGACRGQHRARADDDEQHPHHRVRRRGCNGVEGDRGHAGFQAQDARRARRGKGDRRASRVKGRAARPPSGARSLPRAVESTRPDLVGCRVWRTAGGRRPGRHSNPHQRLPAKARSSFVRSDEGVGCAWGSAGGGAATCAAPLCSACAEGVWLLRRGHCTRQHVVTCGDGRRGKGREEGGGGTRPRWPPRVTADHSSTRLRSAAPREGGTLQRVLYGGGGGGSL